MDNASIIKKLQSQQNQIDQLIKIVNKQTRINQAIHKERINILEKKISHAKRFLQIEKNRKPFNFLKWEEIKIIEGYSQRVKDLESALLRIQSGDREFEELYFLQSINFF